MSTSFDAGHDYAHAKRMDDMGNVFFREHGPDVVEKKALNLAVWWHDVSKALTKPTLLNTLYLSLNEGRVSKNIFLKNSYDLDKQTQAIVAHAIESHSMIWIPKLTPEAKLLSDLDIIDLFHWERWKNGLKHLPLMGGKFANSPAGKYIMSFEEKHLFHAWSKAVFKQKKEEFEKKMNSC